MEQAICDTLIVTLITNLKSKSTLIYEECSVFLCFAYKAHEKQLDPILLNKKKLYIVNNNIVY